MNLHTLGLGRLDLPGMGWHPLTALQAGHMDLRRAQPHRRAGHIHRHVATTQHHHSPPSNVGRITQPHIAQENSVDHHSVQVDSFDGEHAPLVRADGNEHRIEPLSEDVIQVLDHRVETQFNPQVHDVLHLPVHDPGGKAVLGHPHTQHPTGHRQRLEDGDRVPQFA